jgi:hypothetical protein
VDWIHVAQDRDQWRAHVNTVLSPPRPHFTLTQQRIPVSRRRGVSCYIVASHVCLHFMFMCPLYTQYTCIVLEISTYVYNTSEEIQLCVHQ